MAGLLSITSVLVLHPLGAAICRLSSWSAHVSMHPAALNTARTELSCTRCRWVDATIGKGQPKALFYDQAAPRNAYKNYVRVLVQMCPCHSSCTPM